MSIRDNLISAKRAAGIRQRLARYNAWAKQYQQPAGRIVIPTGAKPPVQMTNDERGLLEQYEIWRDKPDRIFAYAKIGANGSVCVSTWPGQPLGYGTAGPSAWRSNFGDKRRTIYVTVAGEIYTGTAYLSGGDYCRLRKTRKRK